MALFLPGSPNLARRRRPAITAKESGPAGFRPGLAAYRGDGGAGQGEGWPEVRAGACGQDIGIDMFSMRSRGLAGDGACKAHTLRREVGVDWPATDCHSSPPVRPICPSGSGNAPRFLIRSCGFSKRRVHKKCQRPAPELNPHRVTKAMAFARWSGVSAPLPCAAMLCPQIGTALCRDPLRLGVAPFGDGPVIAGRKHRRNLLPLPDLRAGVLRMF